MLFIFSYQCHIALEQSSKALLEKKYVEAANQLEKVLKPSRFFELSSMMYGYLARGEGLSVVVGFSYLGFFELFILLFFLHFFFSRIVWHVQC